MSVFSVADRFWERLRASSLRFQAADQTDDQSHVHHALVTVLLFGSVGAGIGQLLGRALEVGLEWGIIFGWCYYAIREIQNRFERWRFDWRYKVWDGICDVLVPLWVTAPLVFDSILLLWLLSAAVGTMYFFLRPIGGDAS